MNTLLPSIAIVQIIDYNGTMKKLKNMLEKYPLWLQCSTLFTLVTMLIISTLILNIYNFNKNSVIATNLAHKQEVLTLELDTVTEYIRKLSAFAIQPRYDSRFFRIIEDQTSVTEEDMEYIKDRMQEYFYTRSDLNSYRIFFPNLNLSLGRGKITQHILIENNSDLADFDAESFAFCDESNAFLCLRPSEDPNDFFTFYQSIIYINDKRPLAYVKCHIDRDFLTSLLRSYTFTEGEILLLYNDRKELLYTGDPELIHLSLDQILISEDTPDRQIILKDHSYMVVSQKSDSYGFTMVSLQPTRIINQSLYEALRTSIMQGLIILAVSVLMIYLLCKRLMQPLNDLSSQLKKVGEGAFDTTIRIGGSQEITNLEHSFNYMSEHIQKLIEENYVVTLNEQTARLIALEAQINPHFLYNTLQAISTEALINDQDQIHEMIISLASILRYSIKGEDLVTLADEMEHVKKYIYLQKIRMDDNLQTSIEIDSDAYTCVIPKISIQTLVENCIVHGIDGEVTSIAIQIRAYVTDDKLHLSVTDNGCGMDEVTLQDLRESFLQEKIAGAQTQGVGLANLYDRLRILYDRNSEMTVDSTVNNGTSIHITLPAKRGVHE